MSNALDDLIAKVEAGSDDLNGSLPWSRTIGVEDGLYAYARDAYIGSLDAAKALHEAVLPGWWVKEIATSPGRNWLVQINPPAGTAGFCWANDGLPSRAWLLAILRAMKEGKDA